jgi:hypothetical protein
VREDDDGVFGEAHVCLECVGACVDSTREGGHCVFGELGTVAAVGDGLGESVGEG